MDGTSPSYIEPFPLAGSVIRLTFDRSIDVPDSCSRTEPNPDFGSKIRVFIWDPVFVKGAFVTLSVGSVLAPSDLLCNFSFRFTGGGRVVEVVVTFQLQEYQTDVGRCRFDINLGQCTSALVTKTLV